VCGCLGGLYACFGAALPNAFADETCNSPYISNLIKARKIRSCLTLGVEGLGDGSDKLVTIDANLGRRPTKGRSQDIGGGRGEAHHMGFTDDRKFLWRGDWTTQDLRFRRWHQSVQTS